VVCLPTLGAAYAVVQMVRFGLPAVDLLLFGVMGLATAAGVEVGFHRYFSHRAFACGPVTRATLAIFGCMAAEGPPLFWVSIHRAHHMYADRPGDPHSPHLSGVGLRNQLRGLAHAHVGWLFTTPAPSMGSQTMEWYRHREIRFISRSYLVWPVVGLLLPALVGAAVSADRLAGAVGGLLWGGLLRMFVVHHFTWSVNSFGHVFGRRAFKTRDKSTNNVLLALPTMGGGWHNNHHANPTAARTKVDWYQVDLAGSIIGLLGRMGVVSGIRPASFRQQDQIVVPTSSEVNS
jgi:stearoyl-CoA desaturase (delta-9 desaturase)